MLVIVIGLSGTFTVFAADAPTAQATIPTAASGSESVTVIGTKGSQVTRTFLVQIPQEKPANVEFVPLDLQRADQQAIFIQQRITPALSPLQDASPTTLKVTVTFDLRRRFELDSIKTVDILHSGQYTGELLITYADGQMWAPVAVTVRDAPYGPIVVLALGVMLGLATSWYRKIGQPRDELIVRMDDLRRQMAGDKELHEVFRKRVEAELVDVEAEWRATQWDAARTQMQAADALWTRWRRSREDWLRQLKYLDETLKSQAEALDQQAIWTQQVQRQIADLERQAASLESPEQLQTKVQAIADQMNTFARLCAAFKQVQELRGQAPEADQTEWQGKILELRRRLWQLVPTDDPATALQLEADLRAAIEDLRSRSTLESATAKGARSLSETELSALLEPLPSIVPRKFLDKPSHAAQRLQWFAWISSALAIGLLVWAGYEKLYAARPDFGVNPSSDYFALLIWGFGMEATRAAVLELLQGRGGAQPAAP